MGRITINDLPEDHKISKEEMRKVVGGHRMMQEMYDQGIDEARGSYDEAKEQFMMALKIMTEHVERQSQIVQKITG